jgi:hypothetical protein
LENVLPKMSYSPLYALLRMKHAADHNLRILRSFLFARRPPFPPQQSHAMPRPKPLHRFINAIVLGNFPLFTEQKQNQYQRLAKTTSMSLKKKTAF